MVFDEYQKFVEETAIHKDNVYPILGLAGETGEFMELVKKAWRKDGLNWTTGFDREKATSELGDIIWYVTRIASVLDLSLDQVVGYNISKLLQRAKEDRLGKSKVA